MSMEYFSSLDDVPADFGPSAVTFGKFDGLHLGHRAVIAELLALASAADLTATVLTFDRNPLALLDPDRCPDSIASPRQKRELLADAGVRAVLEVPFDRSFSALSAEEFIERVIVETLHARIVLVGPDPRFGRGGLGHLDTLIESGRRYGFEVRSVAPAADGASTNPEARISSTRIRGLIADGRVADAAELLGRVPSVRAVVVHGQKRGRGLGYPTANLAPRPEGMIPADGVYAGYLTATTASSASGTGAHSDGGAATIGERMPAAISIGNNPTFDGVPARQVEAYVLDRDLDLYGAEVEVEFVERVRGMVRFDSLDELIERMGEDTEQVRRLTA